jgi:hypothetical protein
VNEPKRSGDGGFRVLLLLGAVVSIALAFSGLVAPSMLESILGLQVPRNADGFNGLARLFGGLMIAVGVGYALAGIQPHRNRSLLVPLFIVPVAMFASTIAAMAADEIPGGRGAVFTAYNIAYALLYFRLYPRVSGEIATRPPPSKPIQPPDASTTSTNV